MTSFYTREELENMGFAGLGRDVLLSRKASVYGASNIHIGDNVRIDDFCILSGHITLGCNIHISAYVALYGAMGIELCDYTGISPRAIIFSAMDDFGGDYVIGPVHDEAMTRVTGGKVTLERFVQIGAGSIVFPDITIPEGTVVGAMSLVNAPLEPWTIYAGIPARKIRKRSRGLLRLLTKEQGDTMNDRITDNEQ